MYDNAVGTLRERLHRVVIKAASPRTARIVKSSEAISLHVTKKPYKVSTDGNGFL